VGRNNPWQAYFDPLFPASVDNFFGQLCFDFYWSGSYNACCSNRWQVRGNAHGHVQVTGHPEAHTYTTPQCGYAYYDEHIFWADYVLGTPMGQMEDVVLSGGYYSEGFAYFWPVGSDLGYLVQRGAYCSDSGSTYCPCPLYASYPDSCYKDLLCYRPQNYSIRMFFGITSGDGATDNWDGTSIVVTNDYNMWLHSPSQETRCYRLRGILGSQPCLCCSERNWGY